MRFHSFPGLIARNIADEAFAPSAALSTKLGEELQFERDNADPAAEPDFLASFRAEGVWEVSSSPNVAIRRSTS